MLFFEQELEIYVSSVNTGFTTANTVKLAILPGLTINYKEKRQSTYNYKIDNAPDRLNEKVVTGYTNPTLKFSTYAKPYNDTTNDTCVEKLLLESLMGQAGTDDTTHFETSFASVNQLPEIYVYIVTGNLVYYIENAVVKQAEYEIKLNEYTKVNWDLVGREFNRVETTDLPDTFTDYSDISEFVKSNFSTFNFSFSTLFLLESDMAFLDGTDYVNKGSASATITAIPNISIETVGGLSAYDFGDNNDDAAALQIAGPAWTGTAYPTDGVGNWTLEGNAYWDGTTNGNQNNFWSFTDNTNYRMYYQSNIYVNLFNSRNMYFGNNSSNGNPTFAQAGIVANTWFHWMITYSVTNQVGLLYINGIPIQSVWINSSDNNRTGTAAPNGWKVGGGNNDPWYWGGMRNIAANWQTTIDSTRSLDYTNYEDASILGSTVVRISTDFADDTTNNHTVTNFGCIDQGGYLDSPESGANYFTVARSASWDASGNWSISANVWYGRTGGTYVAGDFFNDGVRHLYLVNNKIECRVNGSTVCRADDLSASYYTESFPKNTWINVAFERKDGVYLLYINGKLRAANAKKNIIPNTIPSTGTANVINFASGYRALIYNLRIDNAATRTTSWLTPKYSDTSAEGFLPILDGSVKISNDVNIVERDTLDMRYYQKLDHYVQKREVLINLTSYLRHGINADKLGPLELYDYIKNSPGFADLAKIDTTLRIGADNKNKIEFLLPKADIHLPEIKAKDVMSGNIKIEPRRFETENDELTIKYYEQDLPSTIYTPDGIFVPETYSEFVIHDDQPIGYWDMQGTSLGNDVINNHTTTVGGSNPPTYQNSTDSTTPDPYCVTLPTDGGNSYMQFFTTSPPDWSALLAADGVTIEFFWRSNSTLGEARSTALILGSGSDNVSFMFRDPFLGDATYKFSEGYNVGTYGTAWTPTVGTWYHLAFVLTPSTQKLYVDGVLTINASNTISISSDILYLGGVQFVENMSYSHLAVYDKQLAEDRITFHNSIRNEP